MKLNVSCGPARFILETEGLVNVEVDRTAQEGGDASEPAKQQEDQKKSEPTFLDLRRAIAEHAQVDVHHMKIIHRDDFPGKTLAGPDSTPLSTFNFRDNDRLLVMGSKVPVLHNDGAFAALVDYEKKHLGGLQSTFDTLGIDLSALEQNFFTEFRDERRRLLDKKVEADAPAANSSSSSPKFSWWDFGRALRGHVASLLFGNQRHEMLKRMEKRLLQFNETSLRHLESIDALSLRVDTTSEEQALRNREKRKALIDGIQDLLNQNDKFLGRLKDLRAAILAEEEEGAKK